jgi:5-methylcytosine-specific restriction enzyme subunit McrC
MNRFFQALLSRFLAENLPDHRFREEHRLRGLIAYVPAYNPRNRQASRLRPDFVITSPTGTTAILDAKYRDLWERPLPREMLYQLALYAMSHEGAASTILYPTMQPQAREARIEVREPVHGGRRAIVIVKPVDLAYLERLTTGRTTPSMIRERRAYAIRLAFGESAGSA